MLASALQSVRNFDRRSISRYLLTLVALFAMTTGALADEATITLKCGTTEKTYENVTLPWSTTGEILKAVISDYKNVASNIDAITGGDGKVVKYGNEQFTVTGTFSGEATVVVSWYNSSKQSATITVTAPGPLLTLNEAKTEATMESMPTYDVTVDYELVRDMSVSVDAEILNRIRIQQVESKFVPVVEAEINPAVTDKLDAQNPVTMAKDEDYKLVLQKKEEGETPTWTDVEALSVGTFRYQVTGTGLYDGEIYTNEFQLYEGYEVVIPAGEYVTYYKNEAVRLEEKDKNDIELCTITAVEDGKAVLSDNFDAMKANTPFLLKNTTNEEKTILLIPCTEPDLAVTVAKEFKGTEGAKEFTEDDMAAADYYVCNGKQFVKVRGAGTLGANMAYLKVTGNAPASIPFHRSIDGNGEGTTGIDNLNVNDNEATWYDLGGRRLQGKPGQKGIYIKNGRKVVVH